MRIGRVNILLLTFISILFLSEMNAATPQVPDFAFPKKVRENSEKNLKAALAADNGPAIVRSLIDSYLAQELITSDSVPGAVARIEKICSETSDPVLKAMLSTLEADVYLAFYNNNRWKYDRRELPLSPYPADIKEWSGDQFKLKISTLLDRALAEKTALKKAGIDSYKDVITFHNVEKPSASTASWRQNKVYFPTLFDFVAYRAIDCYNSFSNHQVFLSWGLLTRNDLYIASPFNCSDPYVTKILDLYASILSFHKDRPAPLIYADIRRIGFVTRHIYDSGESDSPSAGDRQAELLRELYNDNRSSEYSGDVLIAMSENYDDLGWYYKAVSRNIKAFPAFNRVNNLKNIISRLGAGSLNVKFPEVTGPGIKVNFSARLTNASSGKIYIYNVSSSSIYETSSRIDGFPSKGPVAVLPVNIPDKEIPFSGEVSVSYTFPEAGLYIAIPVIDGETPGHNFYQKIHVSDYSIAASSFGAERMVWGINSMTGAPVADADITLQSNHYNRRRYVTESKVLGQTDSDGSLKFEKGSGYLTLTKGKDRFAPPVHIYYDENYKPESATDWRQVAAGYSALALYHPGDSVDWTAICYEYRNDSRRLLIEKEIQAILLNPSGAEIDTLRLTTDRFGRVSGRFLIPAEGLMGSYRIAVNGSYNAVTFEVSDYKLPTYRVILDPVEMDVPSAGDATLRGRLETYAGFPVGEARLTVRLAAVQKWLWWRAANPVEFHSFEATSGPDGKIDITIPKSVLMQSPIPDSNFRVEVTALSSTGESQTADVYFGGASRYFIRLSAPLDVDISKPTSAIAVKVVNYLDTEVEMPVEYSFVRNDSTVLKGTLLPGNKEMDLTSLSSGNYTLKVALADSALAKPVTQELTLYRPDDTLSPDPDELLWYPSDKLVVRPGETASWLYAVNCPTYLLVTLYSDLKIWHREWVKVDAGMHRLPVTLPDSLDKATMEINLTGNYRRTSARIYLTRGKAEKSLKFKTESFRDRVVPGAEETWTFMVTDENGKGEESAVILDMYNTALDALVSQSWSFNPEGWKFRYYYNWDQRNLHGTFNSSFYGKMPRIFESTSISQPEFYTYGMPFGVRIFGSRAHAMRPMMKSAAYDTAAVEESADYDRGVDNLNVVREHKEEVIVTNAAGALAEETAADAESSLAEYAEVMPEAKEPAFAWRDREVPLAFFQPMLVTDKDGRLSFSFTVPNANTTWGFRALAYTDSLLSTSFAADVVASKPVMVQPNLPRFLRAGDKASVIASVMNGSGEEQTVETRVELFNASDGKTVKEYTQSDVIAPNSSAVVRIDVDAPADAPFIGYRIKSSTDRFADGEQTLLPVLPSVSPVYESYPFYLSPDQKDFSMQLPVMPADARATLRFCDNPTWYVVTALPGILDLQASTANEASASIFSAAVASGLLRDNPMIGKAIEEWLVGDRTDGTLTSMLERNSELKQVLLSATPWMLDAANDTERMTRLALLFDEKTVESTLKANIATLKKLICPQGGWAWMSSYKEPSLWTTENVLLTMGKLHTMGYLPESQELRRMIVESIDWLDSEIADEFAKDPDRDFTLYVYLRDTFKDFKGAPATRSKVVAKTVQRILSDWKRGSVFDKAIYARILADNSYRNVASTILTSLREYSEYSPTKGMWWPSLDDMTQWSMGKVGTTSLILEAFAAVEPGCEDIDRIRQWLILQKEAKDWGTSVTTTQAISSILSTSKSWIKPAGESRVSVGGKEVKPARAERLTGSFSTPVSWQTGRDAELEVKRKGDTPTWGSLSLIYTDAMASVKAASCPQLSIEKSFILKSADAQGKPVALLADSLKVGDRINVTLTLRVDRDMDYVTIVDERPACFEPVDQLATPLFSEGLYFYRENRDSETRLFIRHLPKGTYILTYDVWVNNAGAFASGLATAQSQYAPQFTAHSAGTTLSVN